MAELRQIQVAESGAFAAPEQELRDLHGEKMVLNMGPSHPATHGVLRIVLELDGEIITAAKPEVGYDNPEVAMRSQIVAASRSKIIHHQNLIASGQKAIRDMRTDETRSAGNQYSHPSTSIVEDTSFLNRASLS